MEHDIGGIYKADSALNSILREFRKYMDGVKAQTEDLYNDYEGESDREEKAKKKKVYEDEVKKLTFGAKEYNALVKKLVDVLAKVNQKALDVSNDAMVGIYVDNYNQVADDCKKVGIKVG